jgi:uncharacterized peroxidase-related enzyme
MQHNTAIKSAPRTIQNAAKGAQEVLETAQAKLGFIPNLYANMANSPGALATYFSGYNSFREHSGFSPAEQEVVFLTISKENGCEYCFAAHSMIADKMSGVPFQAVQAIRDGQIIDDAKLAALSVFVRAVLLSRGHPVDAEVKEFLQAGFEEAQILEIVLAIAVKTISNYTNHLFNTSIDSAFASYATE